MRGSTPLVAKTAAPLSPQQQQQQEEQPPMHPTRCTMKMASTTRRYTMSSLLLCVMSSTVVMAAIDKAGFGYQATTDVSNVLNLALDVRDMREADIDSKKEIYFQGKHALPLTLADLSLTRSKDWGDYPMYNMYRHAFLDLGATEEGDADGNFDGAPVEVYANTLVNDLFRLNLTRIEAEGALVLNVMQAVWSSLWDMLAACKRNDESSHLDMHAALDEAAALWVGAEQEKNSNEAGYMLYNLAEVTGFFFGQDSGETRMNTEVLEMFNLLQSEITNGVCATESGYGQMRMRVKLAVRFTNVVLVQMLLHRVQVATSSDDSNFVELYALAILPQIESCDTALYEQLIQLTVKQDVEDGTRSTIVSTLQQAYKCLQVKCDEVGAYETSEIPVCVDQPRLPMASYLPANDVRRTAAVDRDIRLSRMSLRFDSYTAFQEIYQYGWNSDVTLKQLATNAIWPSSPSAAFESLKDYYGTYDFVDDAINLIIDQSPPFDETNEDQDAAVVIGLLQSTVMYLAAFSQLQQADATCANDDAAARQTAGLQWDQAAAYYIGSTEGPAEGGQDDGESVYGLGKQFCQSFGVCEPTAGSAINEIVVDALSVGQKAIQDGKCDELHVLVARTIQPAMLVPLVQGTILYSAEMDSYNGEEESPALGDLYSFSAAVQPAVAAVSPDAAAVLKGDADLENAVSPESDRALRALQVFRHVLANMPTDCAWIGKFNDFHVTNTGVCETDTPPATPAPVVVVETPPTTANETEPTDEQQPDDNDKNTTATDEGVPPADNNKDNDNKNSDDIAWGRYDFVNKDSANTDAMFAIDVKEMYQAATPDAALAVYERGRNATAGKNWESIPLTGEPDVVSLQQFSTRASTLMSADPTYNFFRVALYEDDSFEDEDAALQEGWPYADNIVQLALNPANGNSAALGAEAAVVLNVWMVLVNRLYEAVRQCRAGRDAPELIDSAVALWIGRFQSAGLYDAGWLMYAVSQRAAAFYDIPEGETPANTNLMLLFNVAQSMAKTCSQDPSMYRQLRMTVIDVVRDLTKPLLQHLLYYMSKDDRDMVELYALSFVPQTIACGDANHDILKDSLYEGFSRDASITENVVDALAKSMQCLRFTCKDLGDTKAAGTELKHLVNAVCTTLNNEFATEYLAAYKTDTDVSELARLDLDVHQIQLFMRVRAYDLAADYYENGMNSQYSRNQGLLTLKQLATDDDREEAGSVYKHYTEYLESNTYADDLLNAVFESRRAGADDNDENDGLLAGASRLQLSETVFRTLQVMVTHMQIVSRLKQSMILCPDAVAAPAGALGSAERPDPKRAAKKLVDEAAALFVGSIEGPEAAGVLPVGPNATTGGGSFLFALGKEFCADFGTCEASGDAASNEIVLFGMQKVKEWIDTGDCDVAQDEVNDVIDTGLPVAMIQGTIRLAFANDGLEARTEEPDFAAGFVLASSILPMVDAVNRTSAAVIDDNMDFNLNQKPVLDGAMTVVDAFASVLTGMGVPCNSIGQLRLPGEGTTDQKLDLCASQKATGAVPIPETPTNLGDDLYVTTTYVQDRANIAFDIADMETALGNDSPDLARALYENGEHSEIYNSAGIKIGVRTLSGFSTDAARAMTHNPLFYRAVYALQDSNGNYLDQPASQFADSVVKEAFSVGKRSLVASEAAVALNLWMQLANELYETLALCREGDIADQDGVHSLDEAVAYWIGDGEVGGEFTRGHLLYALAEEMADVFDEPGGRGGVGQSRVNANILKLFNQAKLELSYPNACSDNPNTYRKLKHAVDRIVSQMMVVNVQALEHFLRVDDRPRVRVYAHAVVPLASSCRTSTFAYLKQMLLDGPYPEIEVDNIVKALRSTYACFGISCSDVGAHKQDGASSSSGPSSTMCKDPVDTTPIAGYRPATNVRSYAALDYDLQELDVLLAMRAYGPAEELYTHGKHAITTVINAGRNRNLVEGEDSSGGSRRTQIGASEYGVSVVSLAQLATSSSRSLVPQFDAYKRYHDDNGNYADAIIREALTDESMDDTQRRFMVTGAAQYLVLPMAAMQAMHEAIGDCQQAVESNGSMDSTVSAAVHWDKAVAFLTGLMEGPDAASADGRLLWALAKRQCHEFGTCSTLTEGSADAIDELTTLFYSGRGALRSGSCDEVRKVVHEITPLLYVPTTQATLSSAFSLAAMKDSDPTRQRVRTEAHVYSQSILPLLEDTNKDAAAVVKKSLDIHENENGVRDPAAVSAAITGTMSSALRVDCHDVGASQAVNACTGQVNAAAASHRPKDKVGMIVGCVVGTVAVIAIAALLCCTKRKRKKEHVREDKPVFITTTNGEFNHASVVDGLIKRNKSSDQHSIPASSVTGDPSFEQGSASLRHDDDPDAANTLLDRSSGSDTDDDNDVPCGRDETIV